MTVQTAPEVVAADAAPGDETATNKQDNAGTSALSSAENSINSFDPSSVAANATAFIASIGSTESTPRRGRPLKSDEDKAEAKRARDRARYQKKTGNAAPEPEAEQPKNEAPKQEYIPAGIPAQAFEAAAVLIVSTMDMLLAAISDGEYRAAKELREAYIAAWAGYLKTTGKEPPPWLIVSAMSAAYTLPAFNTEPAKNKWEKFTNKFKGWWVGRFGTK
jgi:hypothetical protein